MARQARSSGHGQPYDRGARPGRAAAVRPAAGRRRARAPARRSPAADDQPGVSAPGAIGPSAPVHRAGRQDRQRCPPLICCPVPAGSVGHRRARPVRRAACRRRRPFPRQRTGLARASRHARRPSPGRLPASGPAGDQPRCGSARWPGVRMDNDRRGSRCPGPVRVHRRRRSPGPGGLCRTHRAPVDGHQGKAARQRRRPRRPALRTATARRRNPPARQHPHRRPTPRRTRSTALGSPASRSGAPRPGRTAHHQLEPAPGGLESRLTIRAPGKWAQPAGFPRWRGLGGRRRSMPSGALL